MDKGMLIPMCQLSEGFVAFVTLVGPFTSMCTVVHLQVRQLTKQFVAYVAPVLVLAVLLFQSVRQSFRASQIVSFSRRQWLFLQGWLLLCLGFEPFNFEFLLG